MEYTIQEKDFVERTIKIIEQYDSINIQDKERYEVTLLLNCMVGLLILPQQKWLNDLPSDIVTGRDWGIDHTEIKILPKEKRTVRKVAKHLRDAISHNRFLAFNEGRNINSICFINHNPNTKKDSFEVTLSVANLRKFVERLSNWHLCKMQQILK